MFSWHLFKKKHVQKYIDFEYINYANIVWKDN